MADRDLFPWLENGKAPVKKSIDRAATVVADRLCGAIADPIIRNAQEERQLSAIRSWLESKGYRHISAKNFDDLKEMPSGTFTFRMNVSVGKGPHKNNIPIDALIQPLGVENAIPVFVEASWPGLWEYMKVGMERGVSDCYICSHRKVWFWQEKRTSPLFFITYMGRVREGSGRNPFRFILNRSQAIATNVYLYIYPRPFLKKLLADHPERTKWLHQMLNRLSSETLIQNGRTYGGGLHKLEPKELAGMPLSELPGWLKIDKEEQTALPLFE